MCCISNLSPLYGQQVEESAVSKSDTAKTTYYSPDRPFIDLYPSRRAFDRFAPSNIYREVEYDPKTNQYIVRERIGNGQFRVPRIFSLEEYQRYEAELLKRENWTNLSKKYSAQGLNSGLISPIRINSESFERIFGGNTINIVPRGSVDMTLMGQKSNNTNPMFTERQRKQFNFDFDQRIQMNLTGQVGERMRVMANYNTEAQFDFENQIKFDYVGKDDDIIQRIEVGNVSMPLTSNLISGSQSLFGVKTQLKFGKLQFTGVLSQQRSQTKVINISNGSKLNEFILTADNYEQNKHFFLAQYFRDNYNKALANAPVVVSNINITQIEVWITNRSNTIDGNRDIVALMDLGENTPYNQGIGGGGSVYPSAGPTGDGNFPAPSNQLLNLLAQTDARYSSSNAVSTFFQNSGGSNNYSTLSNARKLTEQEFTLNARLGYISLNMPLNADQVVSVAYRYIANGREYQVGEFSTDIAVTPTNPQVLFTKLLKSDVLKPNLPVWDLMMKNIYSLGAYQVSPTNFVMNITRTEDETGAERSVMFEGQQLKDKSWIQLVGLDRLNAQQDRQPDGVFDFLPGITIDAEHGRIMFPVLEPFGRDLAEQFDPNTEAQLIEKYTYYPLYDSTKVIAQQLFANKNRYLIRGKYESQSGSSYSLNAINVPRGSVRVVAGNIPLVEGTDYIVDYDIGSVSIINQSVLSAGQPIQIRLENNELFGLQQRNFLGSRLDYRVNEKLQLGGTYLKLSEMPLTQKVNITQEPINNSMYGFDVNYNSPSRWLTRMVDKIPFLDTKEESSVSFYGEFAALKPGYASALDMIGGERGVSYIDDFEYTKSVIDLKGALSWQISGTPQMFPEHALTDDLAYGYNRAKLAFYNIDPVFYRTNDATTPSNIRNNPIELSNHYVREVLEQEVFPNKSTTTGQPLFMTTLDLAYYPMSRGMYNFSTNAVNMDGTLANPKARWGGIFRQITTPDFEAQNVAYIELWMMDPFAYKPNAEGGDLYFNLGNISEDILKDGRRSVENGIPSNGDYSNMDLTSWGRVPRLQPSTQAFDNSSAARAIQDVGLDALNDDDERIHHSNFLNNVQGLLAPPAYQQLLEDPSGDNFKYFRGQQWDNENAGILKRYEYFNGTEGNSKTAEQSLSEDGIQTAASTLTPDGEDVNRDNTMNQTDEYYEYKLSIRPGDLQVGKNYVVDMIEAPVELPNGVETSVKWYQIRIPIYDYVNRVGDIQDFKSIRFMRTFMTNFADTTILRLARFQLVRGDWRDFNIEKTPYKVIADPSISNPAVDNSEMEIATVSIEENGARLPIPYVTPPGIQRQYDNANFNTNVQLNEQALSLEVKNLRDGYGRAAYKTTTADFRAYKNLRMFVHAEGEYLRSGDLNAFIRVGTDGVENYYEYELALTTTLSGTSDAELIWPEENRFDVELNLFQQAKEARDRAINPDGSPWAIDVPYTFMDGSNKVTIKGQPDLSKIRFYMLGVKNPLALPNSSDDGLDKSGIIWFNELRLTDFDQKGGWAAAARLNAKLADFADVTIAGSKSTIGFGDIDKRIWERQRSDIQMLDISTAMQLGKFFPATSGIQIPMYFNYSNQISTPEYNPLMPDIELKTALQRLNSTQQDSLLRMVQDYTVRRGISFMNVRKLRMDSEKPVRLWDVENFSASYAFNQYYHRDYLTQNAVQKNYRASLSYDYIQNEEHYFEPLKKLFKGKYTKLLSEFNFNLKPSLINFRVDAQRMYAENTYRDRVTTDYVSDNNIGTLYNKNFTISRLYGFSWNLTRSLRLDFNATNLSVVDEAEGQLTSAQRDTMWRNFLRLGRNTNYNHMINFTYDVPINKLPGLDWVSLTTRYGSQFVWQTEPLLTLNDPNINLGNTIQNSRNIQLNPTLNLSSLYNKWSFFRPQKGPTAQPALDILKQFITSIRQVTAAFTRVEGTFLPGYVGNSDILGYDFDRNAPGWGFILGSQRDIRAKAIANNWITYDSLQTQLYIHSLREDLSARTSLEPIKSLRIDLLASRIKNRSQSSQFLFNEAIDGLESVSSFESGDYSVSSFALKTAFKSNAELFEQFQANRPQASTRLGSANPNSIGQIDGYADGYGENSQEVLLASFLSAYTGKSVEKQSLNPFPSFPIPNWNISYTGLSKLPLLSELVQSMEIKHGYRSSYNVNGYSTLLRYAENNGASSIRDFNDNFLPKYQITQVTLQEQFLPLIGINTRFKNSMTANGEYRRSRTLSLSMQNGQLAQLLDEGFVFGFGYRMTNMQMPFGLFGHMKTSNDVNFKVDFALNDMKTQVFRSDVSFVEISAGSKNITLRPSIDYLINKRFNIRLFYDSTMMRPYTSQTFATSYVNFGFNFKILLQ
ncbi:cell surface protein SprA [Olivibacter sitiensis]|uniref:T9SS outer membrane translocon Sov/SprA n=1 Tax=Olivibacter sitiensis TaxID=376470 RepID=UPI000415F7B3|nr:cell surface protein SprA [Olivibacter sitiensis]